MSDRVPRLAVTCKAELDGILGRYPDRKSAILPVLHLAQREYGTISDDAMREVAEIVGCRPVDVYDVVTFYTVFHREPPGKYLLEVCRTLSCALLGGRKLTRHLEERLGIECGQTTPDGLFTLREVECIGACSNAPAMLINNRIYEDLTAEKLASLAPVSFHGPRGIYALARAAADGGRRSLIIHLVNTHVASGADRAAAQRSLSVTLRPPALLGPAVARATWHAPGADPLPLEWDETDDGPRILVPRLAEWGIIRVDFAQ